MACSYFIACESAKTEGFLFESPTTTDYLEVEVEGLNERLDELTSCTWVKFKDSFCFLRLLSALLAISFAWADDLTSFTWKWEVHTGNEKCLLWS